MQVQGFCPTQGKDYTIDVSYLDASDDEELYLKGTFRCEYNLSGDKCNGNKCPLYASTPAYKR